jgi:hypothetical protein
MAWPNSFVDGDLVTAARLNQWLNSIATWGGPVDANRHAITKIGAISFNSADITCVNGNNQDVPVGSYSLKITGPTAAFAIGGFAAGADGQHLIVHNMVTQTMTILHQNTGSALGNRISSLSGLDVVVRVNAFSQAHFRYCAAELSWLTMGFL